MNFLNKGRIYFIVLYFSRIYKERVEDDQEEVEGSIGGGLRDWWFIEWDKVETQLGSFLNLTSQRGWDERRVSRRGEGPGLGGDFRRRIAWGWFIIWDKVKTQLDSFLHLTSQRGWDIEWGGEREEDKLYDSFTHCTYNKPVSSKIGETMV